MFVSSTPSRKACPALFDDLLSELDDSLSRMTEQFMIFVVGRKAHLMASALEAEGVFLSGTIYSSYPLISRLE